MEFNFTVNTSALAAVRKYLASNKSLISTTPQEEEEKSLGAHATPTDEQFGINRPLRLGLGAKWSDQHAPGGGGLAIAAVGTRRLAASLKVEAQHKYMSSSAAGGSDSEKNPEESEDDDDESRARATKSTKKKKRKKQKKVESKDKRRRPPVNEADGEHDNGDDIDNDTDHDMDENDNNLPLMPLNNVFNDQRPYYEFKKIDDSNNNNNNKNSNNNRNRNSNSNSKDGNDGINSIIHKKKRKKKRSRQKNIKKDNRPKHLLPDHLTDETLKGGRVYHDAEQSNEET